MELFYYLYILSYYLLSGFQITVILLFLLKRIFKKHDLLWKDLFLLSNCILLVTSIVYGITSFMEVFKAWYSQVTYEQQAFKWRATGGYWWSYWIMAYIPFLLPQVLWFKRLRSNYKTSMILMLLLTIGPLFERFVIILTSRYRDYLPSSWTYYAPDPFEYLVALLIFCAFLTMAYFLFRKRLIKN